MDIYSVSEEGMYRANAYCNILIMLAIQSIPN